VYLILSSPLISLPNFDVATSRVHHPQRTTIQLAPNSTTSLILIIINTFLPPSWTCTSSQHGLCASGLAQILTFLPNRLTQAEQRQLEQRMQKRQVKEFMGVCPPSFRRSLIQNTRD
jgi:hypothetical protein